MSSLIRKKRNNKTHSKHVDTLMLITILIPLILFFFLIYSSLMYVQVSIAPRRCRAEPGSFILFYFVRGRTRPLRRPKFTVNIKSAPVARQTPELSFCGYSLYRRLNVNRFQLCLKKKKVPIEKHRIVNYKTRYTWIARKH